jgi:two-component system response regulator VicR
MKTILIVEDEYEIAAIVEMGLNLEGYQAILSQNGKEALDLLKKVQCPDLIISDLMMPVLDGYEFITALRAIDDYRKIPVIIVSAGPFDQKRLAPGSWTIFMAKPFHLDRLYGEVLSLIGKS